MSKAQTWEAVEAILKEHKHSKALAEALEAILAPKSKGSVNPPKEIDGVMHYYCRFHQTYEPADSMVMSGGKSKGYCKAAISVWNKRNSEIKRTEAEISDLVLAGDFQQAQECTQELQTLKANLNDPSTYDLEQDWANFTRVAEED